MHEGHRNSANGEKPLAGPTFISWSGMRARTFGIALRRLLRNTGDHFNPWISETDIPLGVNWRAKVDEQLQSAKAGIVVLTLENFRSPWLIYEAGRMVERGITVIPIRVDLPTTMLPRDFPLIEQSVDNSRHGMQDVVRALNEIADPQLSSDLLNRRFEAAWPQSCSELERPYAVFDARTEADRLFCEQVFLDIARESMAASCRSLALYAECGRIMTLTDWSKGFGMDPKQEGCSQKEREQMAREFEALRHMVQAALSEPGSVGAESTRIAAKRLAAACKRVHDEVTSRIEALPPSHAQAGRLAEFAALSRTYRDLRETLAREEGIESEGELPSNIQKKLEDWICTLPVSTSEQSESDSDVTVSGGNS